MKVFTSPVLRRHGLKDTLVTENYSYKVVCLSPVEKVVWVPLARYYDIQLSRRRWADGSGVQITLEWCEMEGQWLWSMSGVKGNFSRHVDRLLTKSFGKPKRPFTIYWRLRYWN